MPATIKAGAGGSHVLGTPSAPPTWADVLGSSLPGCDMTPALVSYKSVHVGLNFFIKKSFANIKEIS